MHTVAVDTHAILWALEADKRLSGAATDAIKQAERILVPAICLVEITYLVEKGKLNAALLPRLFAELENPATTLQPAALDLRVALALPDIPRFDVPDMPDRIIAATALFFSVPLVTRDGKIQASGVQTIW